MSSFLDKLNLGEVWSNNDVSAWATLLLAIFLGLLAGRILTWALGRVAKRCETRGWMGRAQLALDMVGPANLAMLTLGLNLGLADLRMSDFLVLFARKTLLLLYTIAVFWYAYNLVGVIDMLVRRLGRNGDVALDRQIVLLVSRSLRVFLVVIATLYVAESVFNQDIGAWLAGLGIVGLAVSLAAQDSLKHLFGSVTILLDRSFGIGDYIVSGTWEGTVEDIGFRSTRLRAPTGRVLTIPNSAMVNNPIENVSRRPAIRRIVTLLIAGQTPAEKLREVLTGLRAILDDRSIAAPLHPFVNGAESVPLVQFEDIQSGAFKVTATYWHTSAPEVIYAAHTEQVNLRIIELLSKAGVELTQPLVAPKPGG
jgi:MscS family membrane protein